MRRADRQIVDPARILAILQKADVCRIAMCENNVPYIVALNFGLGADGLKTLYFHCADEGKKLSILRTNPLVCFQADIDHELVLRPGGACTMRYQSVVGMGHLNVVDDAREKVAALGAIMAHYAAPERDFGEELLARTTVLRLDITEITGKAR